MMSLVVGVLSDMVSQSEAHLNDEVMEYIWDRIDKNVNFPCHQWIGPLSGSKSTQGKHGKWPTPRAKKQIDGERHSFMPHIVIYNYHHYPDEESPLDWNKGRGDEIRRTCGNSLCMNIEHLILGTRKDTIQSSIDRGTTAIGNTYGVKYDAEDVRSAHESGMSYKQIMREFNIPSKGTISYIINKAKR